MFDITGIVFGCQSLLELSFLQESDFLVSGLVLALSDYGSRRRWKSKNQKESKDWESTLEYKYRAESSTFLASLPIIFYLYTLNFDRMDSPSDRAVF